MTGEAVLRMATETTARIHRSRWGTYHPEPDDRHTGADGKVYGSHALWTINDTRDCE